MELNKYLYKINRPCLFKNILKQTENLSNNSALTWTPKTLSKILNNTKITFRVGRNENCNSNEFNLSHKLVHVFIDEGIFFPGQSSIWKSMWFCWCQCGRISGLAKMRWWTTKRPKSILQIQSKRLLVYISFFMSIVFVEVQLWCHMFYRYIYTRSYADYKYMVELFDNEDMKNCIDWSVFGFNERNAKDSTFWLGTPNAYTPCHYDTYGYNLVLQVYGR